MDYNEIIAQKLEKIGESYDVLKPYMLKHLENIESLIQSKQNERNNALRTIKESTLTLSSISKELNMSRTTLYNHEQLLKRYIDYSIEESDNSDPYNIIANLKEEKSQLQSQIELMMKRDLDIELIKLENKQLKKELQEKNKELENMHKKIIEISTRKK